MYHLDFSIVKKIITSFKEKFSASKPSPKPHRSRKRKVTQAHIDKVSKFMKSNQGKHVTFAEVKDALKAKLNLCPISSWSIRRILKNELKYTYGKISSVKCKFLQLEYIQKY